MSNQEVEVKVGMWVQIPKLTKKEQDSLNDVTSGKKYQIIKFDEDGDVVIIDDVNEKHCFSLKNDRELSNKPLILLDENQQPLKSIKKETVKKDKPQITAQEMYIKELEKTAKSLRKNVEKLKEVNDTFCDTIVAQNSRLETLEVSNLRLQEKIQNDANDIKWLQNQLDEAHKDQEEMFNNMLQGLESHKGNLLTVLKSTDEIKKSDVELFTDILVRSLQRVWKFEVKED